MYLPFSDKALDALYDVTIAYPFNIPQSEPDLILGNFPREVHFHIKRYPVANLPDSDEELATWCKQRWSEKEDQLRDFYSAGKFHSEISSGKAGTVTQEEMGNRSESNTKLLLMFAFAYWTCFVAAIFILLWVSWITRWFVGIQIVFFLVMGHKGGFELFQADYFNRFFNHRKRDWSKCEWVETVEAKADQIEIVEVFDTFGTL